MAEVTVNATGNRSLRVKALELAVAFTHDRQVHASTVVLHAEEFYEFLTREDDDEA